MNKMENRENCTYENIEFILTEKFIVHHLYKDFRGDDGDDAGYVVAICEKDNKFYLHILEACQYVDINYINLDEKDLEINKGFPDYILVDSIEDAQKKLNELINILDKLHEDNGDFIRDADEVLELTEITDKNKAALLAIMSFPYYEFPQDKINLLKLSETPYVPNFIKEDNEE